ncbi:MGMT family protein [Rubrivirga sp.]|uniref:MGMT family protein n=1 Tax=Rubrivirga sp. TaxID=1885344 RepID=UPI003C757AF4
MADDPSFYERVYDVVRQVPAGRATTYGHVARALGAPRASRGVGWALKAVAGLEGGGLSVPCHRVVNREGRLTGRRHFPSPTVMEERLRSENVPFLPDGRVDLEGCLWIPPTEC